MKLRYKQVPWADWKKVVCLAWREAISAIFGPHSEESQTSEYNKERAEFTNNFFERWRQMSHHCRTFGNSKGAYQETELAGHIENDSEWNKLFSRVFAKNPILLCSRSDDYF